MGEMGAAYAWQLTTVWVTILPNSLSVKQSFYTTLKQPKPFLTSLILSPFVSVLMVIVEGI